MNHEQINYLGIIRESEVHEILVKKTGWEDIHITEHIHQKFQIIYTLSGTLHVYIGSTSYFVPEKHIAWIPAHTAHRLTSNNRQASLVIFYASLPLPLPSEAQSQFAIYPVEHIDQGIELLTGLPAGVRGKGGKYPKGTVNRLVEDRLVAIANKRMALERKGQPKAEREKGKDNGKPADAPVADK